jgi:hypothetical protein
MRGCSPLERAQRGTGTLRVAAALHGPRRSAERPPKWCHDAPVPRSPGGACVPATIDRRRMGRPVHSPLARWSVRFVVRRDAAHRGLSGRRPRTFERTSIPTAVGRGRSRPRVTNRATMSDRPRAGNASGGTYRPSSEITIASRDSGRRSFCCMRRNGGRPPPFPLEEAPRARSMSSVARSRALVCAPAWVAGNRETAASGRIPARPASPGSPRLYSGRSRVTSRRLGQGRSCDRAIRARRPSREAAERPADQSPQHRR